MVITASIKSNLMATSSVWQYRHYSDENWGFSVQRKVKTFNSILGDLVIYLFFYYKIKKGYPIQRYGIPSNYYLQEVDSCLNCRKPILVRLVIVNTHLTCKDKENRNMNNIPFRIMPTSQILHWRQMGMFHVKSSHCHWEEYVPNRHSLFPIQNRS